MLYELATVAPDKFFFIAFLHAHRCYVKMSMALL